MSRFLKKCLSTVFSTLCFLAVIEYGTSLKCVKASHVSSTRPITQNDDQTEDLLTGLCRTYRECKNLKQVKAWKGLAKSYILSFTQNRDRLIAFSKLYNNAVDFHAGVVRQTSLNPSLEELNSPSNISCRLSKNFRLTLADVDKINNSGKRVEFYSERKGRGRTACDVPIISLFYPEYSFKFVL